MYTKIDFKELKEIQKQILKGVSLKDSGTEIKCIAAVSLTSKEKKMLCAVVVLDVETLSVLEEKQTVTDELMQYSPNFVAFREGPSIVQTLKELEIKPDVILIEGIGALLPYKVGTASYVGVLMNKPCLGVSKTLILGRLEEDKILVKEKECGFALKTKEFANPVYVTLGHNLSLENARLLMSKLINPEFKMPYQLHLSHKALLKLKKDTGASPVETGKIAVEQEA